MYLNNLLTAMPINRVVSLVSSASGSPYWTRDFLCSCWYLRDCNLIDMFRSALSRSASYARNLAVPNNCKCIGIVFSLSNAYFFVLVSNEKSIVLQPVYVSCPSTPPSRMLNSTPVMNPSSTGRILTDGSAERYVAHE
jgi:hypothetical protein